MTRKELIELEEQLIRLGSVVHFEEGSPEVADGVDVFSSFRGGMPHYNFVVTVNSRPENIEFIHGQLDRGVCGVIYCYIGESESVRN